MTLVRRFAVWLSGFVVRHASAGSREWAEGLAREVEFVEGDWKALGWAVGGLRVALAGPRIRIQSLVEVPKRAQDLRKSLRMQYSASQFLCFAFALVSGVVLWLNWHGANPMQRFGFFIVAFALLYLGAILLGRARTWRNRIRSIDGGIANPTVDLRSEFQWVHDCRSNGWWTVEYPAIGLCLAGLYLVFCAGGIRIDAWAVLFLAWIFSFVLSIDALSDYPTGVWQLIENWWLPLVVIANPAIAAGHLIGLLKGVHFRSFGPLSFGFALGFVGVCSLLANRNMVRRYQRRIDELDAVLARSAGEGI